MIDRVFQVWNAPLLCPLVAQVRVRIESFECNRIGSELGCVLALIVLQGKRLSK